MGEKDKERPLDRYCRLKNDISQWYDELKPFHFTDEEIKVLEKYYLPRHGVPATQEDLMMVCLEPGIANFTLKDANGARKIVAKKKMNEIEGLKKKFIESCKNHKLGEYVWETTMGPQMGYSFDQLEALDSNV